MKPTTCVRVALADSHPKMLAALDSLLTEAGYDVVVRAADGEALLRAVTEVEADVAIVDHSLPDHTAFELAARLADGARPVPTVLLTANDDPRLQLAAARSGVNGLLVKGCSAKAIFTAVNNAAGDVTTAHVGYRGALAVTARAEGPTRAGPIVPSSPTRDHRSAAAQHESIHGQVGHADAEIVRGAPAGRHRP